MYGSQISFQYVCWIIRHYIAFVFRFKSSYPSKQKVETWKRQSSVRIEKYKDKAGVKPSVNASKTTGKPQQNVD